MNMNIINNKKIDFLLFCNKDYVFNIIKKHIIYDIAHFK